MTRYTDRCVGCMRHVQFSLHVGPISNYCWRCNNIGDDADRAYAYKWRVKHHRERREG